MVTASMSLPFLSRYDPTGSGEGNLDPMGLYQIADQLAVALVPAVRERMQRVRFLTAITVGTALLEGIQDSGEYTDTAPFLVWEWLVVEALVKSFGGDGELRGVAGSQVTQRALRAQGYLDAASYLKTPRIFGFHGIYKRLAIQLQLVDVNLGSGPQAGKLLAAWAKDQGFESFSVAKERTRPWVDAIGRSVKATPPRTNAKWTLENWRTLADAFHPDRAGRHERKVLRELLLNHGDRHLGALADLWTLLPDLDLDDGVEPVLGTLAERAPQWNPLVSAIESYEAFARRLQDGFDALRMEAGNASSYGYTLSAVSGSAVFLAAVAGLSGSFTKAVSALASAGGAAGSSPIIFEDRFGKFGIETDPVSLATLMLDHHDGIQRAKSAEGKRSWVDRQAPGVIHLRLPYRLSGWEPRPREFVHPYRVAPIARFRGDLT